MNPDAIETALRSVASHPTSVSSAGYPFLEPSGYRFLRDRVPHLFSLGQRCLDTLDRLTAELDGAGDANGVRALKVARQVVLTAAITAPADLWLMRNLLCVLHRHGLVEPLLEGRALYPDEPGPHGPLDAHQLRIAFDFLTARGLVEPYDTGVRIAGHPRVPAVLALGAVDVPVSATAAWREALEGGDPAVLHGLPAVSPREDARQTHWVATAGEVEIGHQLVPLVLAMRSRDATQLARGDRFPTLFGALQPRAVSILTAAGWLRDGVVTALGARGFRRGPGPFGIIETYHPYLAAADVLFAGGEAPIWVERGENVAASQDANRATFMKANDALDRFCADHGWSFDVFVEHAVGKGEATRIRYSRDGDRLAYLGADLEDAAIDAAIEEQRAGRLPAAMTFVRNADIGRPDRIVDALAARGLDSHGAVMMVGNGFHEVRGQTDASMIEVFRGYHDAGIVLVFTEENALSSDDIRETAWNTYHAAFRYVHALSGQGLRPADRRPPTRSGHLLPTAWSECGRAAGYVPLPDYGYRSRTIFPAPNADGHNPSISVTHFFLPSGLAARLGIG
ncbi:MAG: hypothetical protein H6737_06425 [Alphaproteobacteria bacterium]|nr:hypothetical protein [Alphaproteobacteria bacterium]